MQDRKPQISERKDHGCSKVAFCPRICPKWKIVSAKLFWGENFLTRKFSDSLKFSWSKFPLLYPYHNAIGLGYVIVSITIGYIIILT